MAVTAESELAQAFALARGRDHSGRRDAAGRPGAGARACPGADLVAAADLPAEDLAAMDGYAVRSVDAAAVRNKLTLAGRVLAGQPWAGQPGPGQCLRIMTGAPNARRLRRGGHAGAWLPAEAGRSSSRAGRAGPQPAPHAASTLTAGSVRCCRRAGACAAPTWRWPGAAGAGADRVFRALRVGVLSTGDELAIRRRRWPTARPTTATGP